MVLKFKCDFHSEWFMYVSVIFTASDTEPLGFSKQKVVICLDFHSGFYLSWVLGDKGAPTRQCTRTRERLSRHHTVNLRQRIWHLRTNLSVFEF